MAHLVRHRTPAGDTVSTEVADLDEAVALVEQLHNEQLAEDVRVFAEVPLRVQTYVRVSIADGAAEAGSPPAAPDPADDEPAPAVTDAPAAADAPPPTAEAPVAPVPPPPGVLAPVRVEAPSADAEALVDATPADARRGLFHRS